MKTGFLFIFFYQTCFSFLAAFEKAFVSRNSSLYTHYSLTKIGLTKANESFFNQTLIGQIYRGNLYRDFSQLSNLVLIQDLHPLFNLVIDDISQFYIGKKMSELKVDSDELGTYKAIEHLDDDCPINQNTLPYYSVNPHTCAMNYLSTDSGNWTSGVHYIKRELKAGVDSFFNSRDLDESVDSFLRFGNALHAMEDFFSHSNFIELAIFNQIVIHDNQSSSEHLWKTKYYNQVFPWVGKNTLIPLNSTTYPFCYPLITGLSSRNINDDTVNANIVVISILRHWNEILSPACLNEPSYPSFFKFLKFKLFKSNCTFMGSVRQFIYEHCIRKLEHILFDQNNAFFSDSNSIFPSHGQLNKDSQLNPLHHIAAYCAIEYNAYVFQALPEALETGNSDELVRRAAKGIIHPSLVVEEKDSPPLFNCINYIKTRINEKPDILSSLSADKIRQLDRFQ
jgi:hypothetical protein